MNEPKVSHPGREQLAAFGSGQLGPAEMAEVERHVASCDTCNAVLETLPDDTLVSLLKKKRPEADAPAEGRTLPAPSEATAAYTPASAGTAPASGKLGASSVPAALREHSRYQVLELLGAGGMGAVFRARHRMMDRPVALKVINSKLVDRPGMVERFHREVKAAARLSHPNIVTAYDAEQAGDTHFLVMEFVEGKSLDRVVQERGPLPVADACDHVRQAALGLQHAHEHGMVHRDIKPHNLMLTPQGRVKILDFGLAHFASENLPVGSVVSGEAGGAGSSGSLTEAGTVMGTPDYIAPEQARDAHAADIRADVYSLGCTLYYLLTGKPPFHEESFMQKLAAHLERMPKPLSASRQDVPPPLARVVEKMMAKDPSRRYQTPAEVADALAPLTGEGSPSSATRPPRWGGGLWVAAAVLLGVLGLAGYLFGPAVYRIATNQGQLVIETDDPDVEVVVKQGGQDVKIIDPKSGHEINLKAGTYQLELAQGKEGLKLSTNQFTLHRGEKQIVRVSLESAAGRVASAETVGKTGRAAEPGAQKLPPDLQIQRNLRQIGLAMINYQSMYRTLPPAAISGKDGKPLLSWRVAILPFIDQGELYKQFHLDEPWDSEHNKKLLGRMPRTYAPVTPPPEKPGTATPYRVFVGKGAAFEGNKGLSLPDFPDGTSNTILVIEARQPVPWTKPEELPYNPDGPLPEVGGTFGGTFATFADGSVHLLPEDLDPGTLRALITRNGGEQVDLDNLKRRPRPHRPEEVPRESSPLSDFGKTGAKPLTQDGVTADQGGWKIESTEARTVHLFEVPNPGVDDCMLIYRARMKTADLQGGAYLEMWCRFPGQGEFFSRAGAQSPVKGATDWDSYETPFRLEKGQRPDLVKLNLVVLGKGTVWIKDVELRQAPLPGAAGPPETNRPTPPVTPSAPPANPPRR